MLDIIRESERHGSVLIINDEVNNMVIEVWGEKRVAPPGQKLKNHVDLFELLGFVDTKKGNEIDRDDNESD